MFSNQKVDKFDNREPEYLVPKEEAEGYKKIKSKERSPIDSN